MRNTEVIPESFNTKFQSVICFGDIRVLEEGKEPYLKLFLEKYSPECQLLLTGSTIQQCGNIK